VSHISPPPPVAKIFCFKHQKQLKRTHAIPWSMVFFSRLHGVQIGTTGWELAGVISRIFFLSIWITVPLRFIWSLNRYYRWGTSRRYVPHFFLSIWIKVPLRFTWSLDRHYRRHNSLADASGRRTSGTLDTCSAARKIFEKIKNFFFFKIHTKTKLLGNYRGQKCVGIARVTHKIFKCLLSSVANLECFSTNPSYKVIKILRGFRLN
jgi:hypothetical protein